MKTLLTPIRTLAISAVLLVLAVPLSLFARAQAADADCSRATIVARGLRVGASMDEVQQALARADVPFEEDLSNPDQPLLQVSGVTLLVLFREERGLTFSFDRVFGLRSVLVQWYRDIDEPHAESVELLPCRG